MIKPKVINLVIAMTHPELFGPWFKGETWGAWLAIAKALAGVAMTELERQIYGYISGREGLPVDVWQLWIMAGRRGGKSLFIAFVGVFYAACRDWSKVVVLGEIPIVAVFCPDRAQGRVAFGYAKAFSQNIPAIRRLVDHITAESIVFKNGVRFEVRTSSWRTSRGYTILVAIVDEAAFLRDETSANPFGELLTALRPAMATTHGLLIVVSTPYSRSGEFYKAHERYFGKEDPHVLFLKAPSQFLNPSLPAHVIDEAFAEDPVAAASEFGSLENGIQFRRDIESFVSREAVDAAVVPDRRELPYCQGVRYVGFVDPSGGSQDSYCLAIAHRDPETKTAILDLVRERKPPFSPEQVTQEYADLLGLYRLGQVHGDRYAGEWPREQFRKHGVEYKPAEKTKSELYRDLLPALNSGKVELLDSPKLVAQFAQLERRTARGGKDSIDHAPNSHDDLINAAAGALVLATAGFQREPGDLGYS